MRISKDRKNGILKLSREEYIKKVLGRFVMIYAKSIRVLLANHFKLSKEQSLKTIKKLDYVAKIPYALAIRNMMYVMVGTRPDKAHVMGDARRYMSNIGKQYWEAIRWIFRYL